MSRNRLLINHTGFYRPLCNALEKRGLEAVWGDWQPSRADLNRTLACFIWFYDPLRSPRHLWQVWQLKRRLSAAGVPLVAWNRDAPHYLNRKRWRLDLLDRLQLFDVYATHTTIDTQRTFAPVLTYLPNAADLDTYSLPNPEEDLARLRCPDIYQWDVSFFGGMNGSRYKEDMARQEFFSALGAKLKQRGITYNFREAEGMSAAEQIDLIQRSRINLNYGARCEYGAKVASGLPERCYGIPASGGFLLCDARTHAHDDFNPGYDWAEFSDIDDCVGQIEYWLAHFDQARDLAERCYRHVVSHHTYQNRGDSLLAVLQAWHRDRSNAHD